MTAEQKRTIGRRDLLVGAGGIALGAAGALIVNAATRPEPGGAASPAPGDTTVTPTPVDPTGRTQAGITRPETPQQHGLVTVLGLGAVTTDELATLLTALSERILTVTDPAHPDNPVPGAPADLTVTVGLGPRLLALTHPGHPAATPLPAFVGDDDLPPEHRDGDLLLALHSDDATSLPFAFDALTPVLVGARIHWTQPVFRGVSSPNGVVRNLLGYRDGIIVPRGDDQFNGTVWLDGDLDGATMCIVRRLRVDTDAFGELPLDDRDRVIGRRRVDGAPLSGGGPDDEVDLLARSPEGDYLIPARSHARAAHPSFTGSPLMLRRSYTYRNGDNDQGILFVSFQNDPATFVRTQQRLDETDDLMGFSTPTASGLFLVLPGFTRERPLGAGLT